MKLSRTENNSVVVLDASVDGLRLIKNELSDIRYFHLFLPLEFSCIRERGVQESGPKHRSPHLFQQKFPLVRQHF